MKESLNHNEPVWHFCDFLGHRVVDHQGHTLGRVVDLVADLREHDPPITGVILSGSHRSRQHLSWAWVEEVLPDSIKVGSGALASARSRQWPPCLAKSCFAKGFWTNRLSTREEPKS